MIDLRGDKLMVKAFFFILFITLTFTLLNINFQVANYKLDKSISELEEENSILRAKYLSDTSISKLDYQATALKMSEISNKNSKKLSKQIQQSKYDEISKRFLEAKKQTKSEKIFISGF